MKRILKLRHEDYPNSWEEWFDIEDREKILVKFNTPQNWPEKGSHYLTIEEAMRQFCLMVSAEGWYVSEETGFHDLIEKYQPWEPPTA